MDIEFSEREIELLIHLVTKSMHSNDDGEFKNEFALLDKLILLDKLGKTLELYDRVFKTKNVVNRKYLN